MRGTSRRGGIGVAVVVSALAAWLIIGGPLTASAARGHAAASGRAVIVIEHAVTDTVVYVGAKQDVTGNLLTFHNKVYDPSDKTKVGTDIGTCTRIDPKAGTWTCSWTTFLHDGQIVVEGPYNDTKNTELTVTGGTRAYDGAHGRMLLISRHGGKEYKFEFLLS
jgi:allene oxide cyclase